MTLKEQIGQRFVVGFHGYEMSEEFKDFLREYKVGNVILFERNIKDREQLRKLCKDIQKEIVNNTGYKAFICIDQEGGNTTRLSSDFVNIEGALKMASYGSYEKVYEAGCITGRELADVGVNFDLAPVLDVNSNPNNPIIGERSYSSNPKEAGEYAMEMARGLMDQGILACGKHFPGHGDTSTDSHKTLPMVEKNLEELEKCELVPFKYAISQGIPAIMTAHILFPNIDGAKYPATMSRDIITGLLREKLGFGGIIFSDCLEMKAIADFYGIDIGALKSLLAGADCVLVSHTTQEAIKALKYVEAACIAGEISERNMEESLKRILNTKRKYL